MSVYIIIISTINKNNIKNDGSSRCNELIWSKILYSDIHRNINVYVYTYIQGGPFKPSAFDNTVTCHLLLDQFMTARIRSVSPREFVSTVYATTFTGWQATFLKLCEFCGEHGSNWRWFLTKNYHEGRSSFFFGLNCK